MNQSLRRLFASAGTLFGGSTAVMALNFLQTLVMARAMGAAGFGIWGTITAFTSLVFAFCTFRTSEAVTRWLVEYRHRQETDRIALLLDTAILTDLGTGLLALVTILVATPWVAADLPGGMAAVPVFLVYGSAQVFGFFDQTWFSVARDLGLYRRIAGLNTLFAGLRVAIIGVLALGGQFSLLTLAWAFLIVAVVQMTILGSMLTRVARDRYGVDLTRHGLLARLSAALGSRREITGFWSFMSAGFLSSIISTLVKEGDTLVLGVLRPAEEIGWYRLGKSLAGMVARAAEMMAQVIYQDFAEMVVRKNLDEIRRSIHLLWRRWTPLVAVVVAVAVVLAGPLVPLVFGAEYAPAITLFRILVIGTGVVTLLFWVRPMALAFDLYWFNFWVVVVIGVLIVPLNLILIWWWGTSGAAVAQVAASVLGYLALLVRLRSRLKAPTV